MTNERDVARTYFDSVERMSISTFPASCWRHGRTVTVTRSVSLVWLLRLSEPTVPRFAVCSSAAGVTDNAPAACAVADEPSTPAQATTIGTARRRVFTDTIREPSNYVFDPGPDPARVALLERPDECRHCP